MGGNLITSDEGLPKSEALAEASIDSLSELFSRDPENLSSIEFDKLIEALRAQAKNWKAAETIASSKPKAKAKISSRAAGLIARIESEDL